MARIVVLALCVLISSAACDANRRTSQGEERVMAASAFTNLYAHSRLSGWNVRGRAAGADCGVLFVETEIIMEDSIVEALHYGGGHYNTYKGGVDKFSRDRGFRGVAYKDSTGFLWVFGDVSVYEAEALAPCR
jgi:hypothetical protein